MTEGMFRTKDGAAISYTVHTRAGAPRVALLHSLGLDRSIWGGVVERLNGRAEILTFDFRGHGRSERRAGTYTAEGFADDLAQLFDHLGWKSACLAGCSMGGCVALAFAGRYPARTEALGLIDTTAWYGAEAPKQFRERADAAKAKGMRSLIDFQLTRSFSDAYRTENPKVMERFFGIFVAGDLECYMSSCALLGSADLRAVLPSIRVPVAIVVGEEDYAAPIAMSQAMKDAIPQASMKIIMGGRHLTPIQCPDEIATEVLTLLV